MGHGFDLGVNRFAQAMTLGEVCSIINGWLAAKTMRAYGRLWPDAGLDYRHILLARERLGACHLGIIDRCLHQLLCEQACMRGERREFPGAKVKLSKRPGVSQRHHSQIEVRQVFCEGFR